MPYMHKMRVDNGDVTLSGGAGTLARMGGKITSTAHTTAAGAAATHTVTNALARANDLLLVTRTGGTNTNGTPVIEVSVAAGQIVIVARNKHATEAFNGTFEFSFLLHRTAR